MAAEPAWRPCPGCDAFWCNRHQAHAFDCECPPIEEWTTDPYAPEMKMVCSCGGFFWLPLADATSKPLREWDVGSHGNCLLPPDWWNQIERAVNVPERDDG